MTERQKLIRTLDDVFSIFIRNRDSTDGIGTCITCGVMRRWEHMDCGHYQGRQHMATRWDEKNCAIQCKKCNWYGEGKKDIFTLKIDQRWGKGTAEMLRIKSKNYAKYDAKILRLLI